MNMSFRSFLSIKKDGGIPMEKVTLQTIADTLNTSRVTVWKALNNRDGVSASLKDEIISTAIELGYPLKLPEGYSSPVPKKKGSHKNVSVVVSRPESSPFWMNIIHSIAMVLSTHSINLLYTYLPSEPEKDYELPSALIDGTVQGIIILNIYDKTLFYKLNDLPIPKVFLDCIPSLDYKSLSGDLFLIEGKSTVGSMVQHIIEKGRHHISFIGDIEFSQTNKERYLGYLETLQKNLLPVHEIANLITPLGIETHKEQIYDFLEHLSVIPNAIICANDFIAYLVITYLQEKGISVPHQVMVTGFDDSREFGKVIPLTTVHVQNHSVGIRLAEQLLYHFENPDADYEIIFIRSKIIFRQSTGDGKEIR